MAKAPAGLRQHADFWKAITIDKKVLVDLDQHGSCEVAQRRGVNPRLYMSKST
jgi:hypothetical protein